VEEYIVGPFIVERHVTNHHRCVHVHAFLTAGVNQPHIGPEEDSPTNILKSLRTESTKKTSEHSEFQ